MDDPDPLIRGVKISANITVNGLADGAFEGLANLVAWNSPGGVTLERLQEIVANYPYRLIRPPNEIYDDLPVLMEPDSEPAAFHVAIRLWTDVEGPSRLVLKLRVVHQPHINERAFRREVVGLDVEEP